VPREIRAVDQQRRADAVRNREAILDAALQVLVRRPDAGLAEVARACGLTRTTVYAHFAGREQLLEELLTRAVRETVALIDASDPGSGPAQDALLRVLAASWQQVSAHAPLVDTVGRVLGDRVEELHAPVADRLLALVRRGRLEGAFRGDVPEGWQLSVYFALVHAAGRDLAASTADAADVEHWLGRSLLGAFAPPATG
jgi:TetR/AcrR family transcriptional repressor of mexCD-oprJ operon